MAPDLTQLVAQILNDAWMVRHYARGGRSAIHRKQRDRAIRQLGLTCRTAFNAAEDFEPVLQAIVDGLIPKEEPRF